MTRLYEAPYTIPAANMGPENPLPMFRGPEDDSAIGLADDVPQEDRLHMGWRTAHRVLPYRMQDEYDRSREVRDLDSLVLENDILRAVFLPGAGGRLMSLVHKPLDRELLHCNPVFQPANLALRNAWLSGGIEWNSGQVGHHWLTCSPVFCARVDGPGGELGLRIYEWDRVKGYAWQIDFSLPDGSPVLFAHVRVVNPHEHEIAMYWWTNIAVDEREDVRVVVPAESALCNPYWTSIQVVDLPEAGGRDMTYSTRCPHAADFFSRIPDDRRHWVAALGGDGTGFFEASTQRLRGRKLFCWGMGSGGRQWQEFLAAPGHAYIEIQAGLARTQMETVPMPGRTEWSWTEAFGYVEADPALVHGADWPAAWGEVGARIEGVVAESRMAEMDARMALVADMAPAEVLRPGSGWGALERLRKAKAGEPDRVPEALVFPSEAIGPDESPWLALLQAGSLPGRAPEAGPGSLMTQPEWAAALERSLVGEPGGDWLAWWHLGNLRMEQRDTEGACAAWRRSLECAPNGWALRNLSVAAHRSGDAAEALSLLRRAWEAGPQIAPLAIELAQALADAGLHTEVMQFVRGLPEEVRSHERMLLHWARAALATGQTEGVERIFAHSFATIREGEVTLTDLWFAYHERRMAAEMGVEVDDEVRSRVRTECPPPRSIDFRMAGA